MANNQLEISENATMNIKAAMVDIEKFMRGKQKEELDKVKII